MSLIDVKLAAPRQPTRLALRRTSRMPDDDANDFFGTTPTSPRRERVGRRPRAPYVPRAATRPGGPRLASAGGPRWPVDEPSPPPPAAGRPASVEVQHRTMRRLEAARAAGCCGEAGVGESARTGRVGKPALPAAATAGIGGARARGAATVAVTRPRPSAPSRPAAAAAASSSAVEPTLLDLSMRELLRGASVEVQRSLLELNRRRSTRSRRSTPCRARARCSSAGPSPTMRAALPSLASRTSLRRLDVSSNRLRSLDGAAGCQELVELLAASNCLRLDAMAPLRQTASSATSSCAATPPRKCCPPVSTATRAALLLRQLATLDASPLDVAAARAFVKADDARRALSDTLGHKNALEALKADAHDGGGVEAARGGAEAAARRRRRSAGRRVGGPMAAQGRSSARRLRLLRRSARATTI